MVKRLVFLLVVILALVPASSRAEGDEMVPGRVVAPGAFDLEIVDQGEDSSYISANIETATLFRDAGWYGVVGLLAHDYLAGELFFDLEVGDSLWLLYPQGAVAYKVTHVVEYMPAGEDMLRDVDGRLLRYEEVFDLMYTIPGRVVFQTCTKEGGFWFVVGE